MKYRLLLTNTADGEVREIIVPAHLPLEELSPKIKVGFRLPLCDYGWHRFLARGTVYVIEKHLTPEQEILFECDLYIGRYRCSAWARLKHVFTVLGSTVTYIQGYGIDKHKIRVTLMERI